MHAVSEFALTAHDRLCNDPRHKKKGMEAMCARPSSCPRSRHPNILVIMSDEHNASVLGCYGDSVVSTPNLDNLARRGVTFDSCYCTSPMCVPSRLSFTAGKYVSRVGAWCNSCWLPSDDHSSLPRLLRAVGYDAYLCGKMHYDRTRRYGFVDVGESMNNWLKTGSWPPMGRSNASEVRFDGEISERLLTAGPGDSHVLSHDRRVTREACAFLGSRGRERARGPFFLLVGYVAPHFPLAVPRKYWEPYQGDVAMPEIPPGHLESQPLNYRLLRAATRVKEVPASVARRAREVYYGMVQWLDDQIGRVLATLQAEGLSRDTVIVYTSDHGENLGEHGLWWKSTMYQEAVRVPMIVSWPERWPGGQRRTQSCTLLDLTRTIADLGGAEVPDDWDGSSMLSWLDHPLTSWRDLAVSEYYADYVASGFAMVRKGPYKYVYHVAPDQDHSAERELYDLEADPGEMMNLLGEARHADLLVEMHNILVTELGESPEVTEQRCLEDYARGYDR